jgi:hypothetical protein
LQDYSSFNRHVSHFPSLTPAPLKAVTIDEVYLFKNGTNKFTPPPGKQPNRQFRIQVQNYLSSPSRAVSEFPFQMFSTFQMRRRNPDAFQGAIHYQIHLLSKQHIVVINFISKEAMYYLTDRIQVIPGVIDVVPTRTVGKTGRYS